MDRLIQKILIVNKLINKFQGPTAHIKRATTEKLREVFVKYASQEKNGERYMTSEDFIRGYLRLFPESNYNKVNKCEFEDRSCYETIHRLHYNLE